MYRQSSSRNQRSKKIKIKHALQICFLVAVCFWLIYQVKHSHDKTNEFGESDAKTSLNKRDNGGFIKIGRKDIHPRVEEIITKNEPHNEETEEDENTEEEVQENKHEEVENLDADVDREEDILDDDDEREDGVENETEEKDSNEAREVLYKADDASSAVTHDTHIETTQNVNERVTSSNARPGNILEQENKETYGVEGGELAKSENPSNVTDGEKNLTTSEIKESTLDDSLNGSPPNSTLIEVSNDNIDMRNSTAEVTTRNPDFSLQNVTRSESGLNQGSKLPTIALQQAKISTLDDQSNILDSNSTGDAKSKSIFEEFSNSSALVKIARSEDFIEEGNETNSATEKNEKLDLIDGTDEVLESPVTENVEEIQTDNVGFSDSSNSLEKNVRMDLDTLPEIQTEGTNSEDIEAE